MSDGTITSMAPSMAAEPPAVLAPPKPSVLVALALLACAATAALLAIALHNEDASHVQVALLEWVSVPYIAAGLVAWSRRPDSRLGVLMVAGGFAMALSALQLAEPPALQTVGALFDILPAALFLHVYLAFPTGRLRSRFERVLVGTAYAAAVGLQPLKMALGAFGPDNPLAIWDAPVAALRLEQFQLLTISAICLAAIGVLAGRRHRAGRPRRRSLALLLDSFVVCLLMIAVLFVLGAFSGPAFKEVQHATLFLIGVSPIVFLAGLLDARLARSAVADLVIGLRRNPTPGELRDALARALRDPKLALAYWLPERGAYADAEGRPVALPGAGDGRTATPIDRADGSEVAVLLHDPSLDDEPELLGAVSAAAAIAIENARLHVELRARLDELRSSRERIVEAGHTERRRLERNLHDGAQQRLVALSLELSMLGRDLDGDAEARERIERARREIAASLSELREIARGIHPAVVTGHGLAVALEEVAALAPVAVDLDIDLEERLPESLEVAAYYFVSESLANVGKYAQATRASVHVARRGDALVVEVVDDGIGGADPARGSGLRGLTDRIEAVGGRLAVTSPRGEGTCVRAEIPVPA
jgi:signal transduction histidine kinase